MKLLYLIIIAFMVVASGCTMIKTAPDGTSLNVGSEVATTIVQVPTTTPQESPSVPTSKTSVMKKTTPPVNAALATVTSRPVVDLPVVFASQAPFGVWDALHEEACEEASIVMAKTYFIGGKLTPHIMEQAILDLVDWESAQEYSVDLTTAESVKILHEYFGVSAEASTDVTVARIKHELATGNLIIVPVAGRELGNPYFTQPGPIYHMLIIRGYDDPAGEFITNDPGTKRGAAYRYRYQTLLSAVHDWDHARADGGMTDAEMARGNKVMIIVSK